MAQNLHGVRSSILSSSGVGGALGEQVAQMRQRGETLIEREATVFEAELGRKNGQDARWLQQVRRSGTTSDKVAALTLLLQVRLSKHRTM